MPHLVFRTSEYYPIDSNKITISYISHRIKFAQFVLSAGERLTSERIDHHLPAALIGTLMNNNQDNERRDTGFIDGPANIAARRITERLERIPGIGNRYRTRSDILRDQEEGNNANQEQIRSNQRANRDDAGAASPMGFFTQLIHQNPELSGVIKATEKYIPFLLIAAAKGFFDHSTGKNKNVVIHCFLGVYPPVYLIPKNNI